MKTEEQQALEQVHTSNSYPDAKKHQTISFIKSGLRIGACIIGSLGYWEWGFLGLGIAEVVGIIEELV